MPEQFDPYHQWLGISSKDQPPNHYRLLGIDLFEAEPNVISNAADQRMAHVRSFQTGKNSDLSQKILNEISSAKICLLNSAKKLAYDEQLRQKMKASLPIANPLSTTEATSISGSSFPLQFNPDPSPTLHKSNVKKNPRRLQLALTVVGIGALLLVGVDVLWMNRSKGPLEPPREVTSKPIDAPKLPLPPKHESKPQPKPEAQLVPKIESEHERAPEQEPKPALTPKPKVELTTVESTKEPPGKVQRQEEKTAENKLVIPDKEIELAVKDYADAKEATATQKANPNDPLKGDSRRGEEKHEAIQQLPNDAPHKAVTKDSPANAKMVKVPSEGAKGTRLAGKIIPTKIDDELQLVRAHGPYKLVDVVTVAPNGKLLVERGTKILCAPGAKIVVEGELGSFGEGNQFVMFRPGIPNRTWSAIAFSKNTKTTKTTILERFDIGGAECGIDIDQVRVDLKDCIIAQNVSGIKLNMTRDLASKFTNCMITNNLKDAIELNGSRVEIDHCTIANNGNVGIHMTYYGTFAASACVISANLIGIKSEIYDSNPEIHLCNIVGNRMAIEVKTKPPFKCENNYWGTGNRQGIAMTFLDGRIKPDVGTVMFEPFEKKPIANAGCSLKIPR